MKWTIGFLCAGIVVLPVSALAFFKPARVLLPSISGLHCINDKICIDDVSKSEEALRLYQDAIGFVDTKVGKLRNKPRAFFCSTQSCSSYFGMGDVGAINVGTFGFVIKPRGWQPYFVRHELIHHLQNERLGSLSNWLGRPKWFVEGMAYALSEDPRHPIPGDGTLEAYRSKFQKWEKSFGNQDFWQAALNL